MVCVVLIIPKYICEKYSPILLNKYFYSNPMSHIWGLTCSLEEWSKKVEESERGLFVSDEEVKRCTDDFYKLPQHMSAECSES